MAIITTLEVQKNNKERVNVYLDGDYAFSLTLIEAVRLKKGQELSTSEITTLREADAIQRAVDSAAHFLAARPRSMAEIRQNLSGKAFPAEVIEVAMERLEALGYLDDAAFARFWLENRDEFRPRGIAALRYELRQKGVADDIIEAVLEDLDETAAAYRAATAQARRWRGLDRAAFRQKLYQFLQRRGFQFQVSRDVAQQLIAEWSDEDPTFFRETDQDDTLFN